MNDKRLMSASFIIFMDVIPLSIAIIATSCFVILSKYKLNVPQVGVVFVISHVILFTICITLHNIFVANSINESSQSKQIKKIMFKSRSNFLYNYHSRHGIVCYSVADFVISLALITVGIVTLCIIREKGIIESTTANNVMLGIGLSSVLLLISLMLFCIVSSIANCHTMKKLKKHELNKPNPDGKETHTIISDEVPHTVKCEEKNIMQDPNVDKILYSSAISYAKNDVYLHLNYNIE